MAGGVDVLSAEMAHKAHIAAVSRDYICEPHLGAAAGAAAGGAGACSRLFVGACTLMHRPRALLLQGGRRCRRAPLRAARPAAADAAAGSV